ncbi:hypothetical protein [Mitsuokella jalaludinii]|uniref:hypothetical protein n=1 Tax=Mitsuokella jalaludinii TaxID=187979 RepID=UPI003F998978
MKWGICRAIQELQANHVDLIIAASHSGIEHFDDVDENQIVSIAKACPELSLLIAAHDHVVVDGDGNIEGPDG